MSNELDGCFCFCFHCVFPICRFGRPLLNFAAVATTLIMIVGICGNALTVAALLKCPKVRNVAAAFIIR